tara:strand:+ start:20823 stop:22025 length:1203 start_codon:yes stop_codon:yes gene_type:complete
MTDDHMTRSSDEGKEKRPSWIWLGVGLGAAALGIAVMMIAGSKGEASEQVSEPADTMQLVETVPVESAPRTYRVHAPGRLEPRDELQLVGEVAGKVETVSPELKPGGRISKGAVILRIDDGDYAADLARAKAQLSTAIARQEQATAERDRQDRLAEIGAAPEKAAEAARASFEDADAAVEQARAQVRIAERAVAKTVIRAPFDALVTTEDVAPGTYVSPGQPLATLISANSGEIHAGLPAGDVAAVRAAIEVEDNRELPVTAVPNNSSISSVSLEGYLAEFSPLIDQASRTATVIAVFPDAFTEEHSGQVFAGDFMDVLIEGYSKEPVWSVPSGSVRQDSFVWVVEEDGSLHKVRVTTIDRVDDTTLFHSAEIDGDERVMTTVLSEEVEGMKVKTSGAEL